MSKTVLDPTFVVNGRKRSLPWILHALEDGKRLQFNHLRPHQEHTWHLFLVRTAAMLGPTDNWNERLQAEGDIWDIYPKPGECGFFQPAGHTEDGYERVSYVEQKDTSKVNGASHRSKTHSPSSLDYWVYALISAQTSSRYDGARHRPSLRTSSGYGDRPYVSKVSGRSWADRFKSDVDLARSIHGGREGIRFLWTEAFQGKEIAFEDCHPLVVDSSRKYRMKNNNLYFKSSWDWPLIEESTDLDADLEDPWLPIKMKSEKLGNTRGTKSSGFTYDVVRDYLVGERTHVPSLQEQKFKEDCYFIAQTIAGDQGGSSGVHHRTVKLPADLSDELFPSEEGFASRSEEYVKVAGKVKNNLLFPALAQLFEKDGSGSIPEDYLDRYETRVDRSFFPHLFKHSGDPRGVERWKGRLKGIAEEIFEDALGTISKWDRKAAGDTIFQSRQQSL
jgi:CRISPR system Cascade subunit CasA